MPAAKHAGKLGTDATEGTVGVGENVQAPSSVDKRDGAVSEDPAGMADPTPKWRAMFFISIFNRRIPVLGDSGCTSSCISFDFFHANPALKKNFTPRESKGTAINGSDVQAIGETRLEFTLGSVRMSIRCKVIKGLMDSIVLGWDWLSKYAVTMDAANGKVHFCEGNPPPSSKMKRYASGRSTALQKT